MGFSSNLFEKAVKRVLALVCPQEEYCKKRLLEASLNALAVPVYTRN